MNIISLSEKKMGSLVKQTIVAVVLFVFVLGGKFAFIYLSISCVFFPQKRSLIFQIVNAPKMRLGNIKF